MTPRRVVAACVATCLWFGTPVGAQQTSGQDYRSLEVQTVTALVQEDFATARALAQQLERLADHGQRSENTSRVAQYGLIAEIMFRIGDGQATVRNYEKAVLAAQSEGLWTHPQGLQVRYELGSALSLLDRDAEAMAVAQNLYFDLEQMDQAQSSYGMRTATLVGSLHLKAKSFDKAKTVFESLVRSALQYDTEGRILQTASNGLANALTELGEFDEALIHTRTASELDLRFNDPNSEPGLYARLRLAQALERAGELQEAREIVEPLLAQAERALPPTHDIPQWARRTLEKIERGSGQQFAARSLNRTIAENAATSEDALLRFDALENLAQSDLAEGDYRGYEARLVEALRFASNNPDIPPFRAAKIMVSLSKYLVDFRGDLQAAQPLLDQAIAILNEDLGPHHVETLRAYAERLYAKRIEVQTENLWRAARKQPAFWDGTEAGKRPTELDLEMLRRLAVAERENGNEVTAVSSAMNYVGFLLDANHFDKALKTLQDELERQEQNRKAGKPHNFELDFMILQTLGSTFMRQGQFAQAVEVYQSGADEVIVFLRESQWMQAVRGTEYFYIAGQLYGQNYATALLNAAREKPEADQDQLAAQAFEAVQFAGYGPASAAVARATIRNHSDDPSMQAFAKELEIATASVLAGEANAPSDLDRIRSEMEETLSSYSNLLVKPPLDIGHVQQNLLKPDEALITILPVGALGGENAINGMVLAVTQSEVAMVELPIPWDQLVFDILELHNALDPVSETQLAALRAPMANLQGHDTQPKERYSAEFSFAAAHRLHNAFFGEPEIARIISPKSTWTLVPYGETLSVPFAALVIEDDGPALSRSRTATDLRKVRWLGHERALNVVPSLNALEQLRRSKSQRKHTPEQPKYVAFGDPVFQGTSDKNLPAADTLMAQADERRAMSVQMLPRLPGTRREVKNLANLFAPDARHINLGPDASEARLWALNSSGALENSNILHFATHGLLSGAFEGLSEPALALTPGGHSVEVGANNDGLLTASEAAQLDIGADWVILSACDTAGEDSISGSGLGGLVSGFFSAGARNLLVSHWRVDDSAAEALISRTVSLSQTGVDKAEALRRAMKELAQDPSRDQTGLSNAHPTIWAPFLIVGSG